MVKRENYIVKTKNTIGYINVVGGVPREALVEILKIVGKISHAASRKRKR